MNQTRTRQPLILVAAIVVAFVLAFAAGQLLSGSSEPNSAAPAGKANELDIGAPAIGSAGAAQALPNAKVPARKKSADKDSTASTGNGTQTQTDANTQQNTTQQNTTQQNTQQQTQQNTQQNTQQTTKKDPPAKKETVEITEGGGED